MLKCNPMVKCPHNKYHPCQTHSHWGLISDAYQKSYELLFLYSFPQQTGTYPSLDGLLFMYHQFVIV